MMCFVTIFVMAKLDKAEGSYLDIGHCKRSNRVALNVIAVAVNPKERRQRGRIWT